MVHLYRGEFELARTHLTEAYDRYTPRTPSDWLSQAEGDTGVAALAYNSSVLWNLGEAQESLWRSDRSLELAEQVGGPVTRAQAWGMRALLHLARLEPTEFARWTERTRAHSVDHNVGYWRALASLLDGALQARAGELDAGCALVDGALAAYQRSGSRLGLSRFYVLQADLRLLSGDHAAAFASLAAAEEHMVSTGERYTEAELCRFKGRLLMAQPQPDVEAATAAFEQAVAAAHRQHAALLELRAATTLALHQRQIGAPAAALERVAQLSDRLSAHAALADLVQARAAARSAGGGPMTHVTIAGGGLAGLSAALRLAERGYRVKLYESKDVLGGNVASRHVGERVWLDVYPHMYLNWYHNFWALLADVTDDDREQLFRPMEGVQWLRAGTYPRFRGLKNPYRPRNLLRNLIDGPAPAADLYLFLYASIDLMAERLNPTLRLGDVSVNGFLRARAVHDRAHRGVLRRPDRRHLGRSRATSRPPTTTRSSSSTASPTRRRRSGSRAARGTTRCSLRSRPSCGRSASRSSWRRTLVSASCAKGRVTEIGLRDADGETRTEDVDELLLALPPAALSRIVRRGESPIVKASPQIAEVARLSAQPVPLIHVYFKRRLQVPAEPTALSGSSLGLAFTDISQTWDHVPGLRRRRDGPRALLVGPVRAARHGRAG